MLKYRMGSASFFAFVRKTKVTYIYLLQIIRIYINRYKQIGYYTKRCMSYQRARLRTEVENNEKDIANK